MVPDGGVIFIGIGQLGYRRLFDPQSIREADIQADQGANNRPQSYTFMETYGGKQIKFDSQVRDDPQKICSCGCPGNAGPLGCIFKIGFDARSCLGKSRTARPQ
jgi:hypothetical protein